MTGHEFTFEGGELLTNMGASWFVSYAYYDRIDRRHMNWDRLRTAKNRISVYNRSGRYHDYWLEKICQMSSDRLSTNQIGLAGYQVKQMASEMLRKGHKIIR